MLLCEDGALDAAGVRMLLCEDGAADGCVRMLPCEDGAADAAVVRMLLCEDGAADAAGVRMLLCEDGAADAALYSKGLWQNLSNFHILYSTYRLLYIDHIYKTFSKEYLEKNVYSLYSF